MLRDGARQGAGDAGSAPANAPSMAELAAALRAAERQPQLLRQVELACVAAAELALSQVRRTSHGLLHSMPQYQAHTICMTLRFPR